MVGGGERGGTNQYQAHSIQGQGGPACIFTGRSRVVCVTPVAQRFQVSALPPCLRVHVLTCVV